MANQQSKNIQYSGLTTLPDDYQSVDGSLAFATNAVYEDNAVKIIPPALTKNLVVQKGDKVYVHSMATYTHYIVAHEGSDGVTLYWVDEKSCESPDPDKVKIEGKVCCVTDAENGIDNNPDVEGVELGPVFTIGTYAGTFVDLAFVGNTMILSTSESLQYVLWKADSGQYIYLGDKIPSVDIQFGLRLELAYENYVNSGITVTDETITVGATDYKQLSAMNFDKGRASGTLNCFFVGSDNGYINMEEGKTYRFHHLHLGGKNKRTFYIYGHTSQDDYSTSSLEDESSMKYLVKIGKSTKDYTYFSADKNYYNIFFSISKNNVRGTIYMDVTEGESFPSNNAVIAENTSNNHTAVMGYMNKFSNERGKKQDKFIYPFFVRYATKMYDGTYCRLSTPILLYPNTGYAPFMRVTHQTGTMVDMYAFVGTLVQKILSTIDQNWKDIIEGVGIFVSEPIYPYDQGQGWDESDMYIDYKCVGTNSDGETVNELAEESFCIGSYDCGEYGATNLATAISEASSTFFAPVGNNGTNDTPTIWQIAKRTEEEINDLIASTCNFYKVAEIGFEDLIMSSTEETTIEPGEDGGTKTTTGNGDSDDGFEEVDIEDGTLGSLEARETLKEEEISTQGFQSGNLFVYNNRLHISGGTRTLTDATPIIRQNGYVNTNRLKAPYNTWGVRLRTDEGIKTLVYDATETLWLPWFFYPDTRAYELLIATGIADEPDEYGHRALFSVFELTTHDFLNGAYFLQRPDSMCRILYGYYEDIIYDSQRIDFLEEDKVVNLANKIYVSEASNPFVFKNAMVCTAGSGQVLALSSAAKALSQGQFGQFPLYAFTDEGIWAMSVGSTGAYETVQPIARDVVTNVAAITQLDSAVVFVTDRGVMLVEGSNVVCMSDDIDGDFGQFDPRTLDGFYMVMKKYLGFSTDDTDKTIGKWASQAFFDFIRSCQMKYDYVHQRITMYSDDCDIAYVYSLKSKQWLMQLTALQDNVNSYPDAYALRNTDAVGGVDCTELVNLSEYDLETARLPMVFVTRPFKLDAPDTFKTVNDIMQRGYFRQDEKIKHIIGTVLYGSPDLFNWFLVKSNVESKMQNLHGSPYKYFRVLVVSQLDAKEGISGCSVWFEPKDTQRLR